MCLDLTAERSRIGYPVPYRVIMKKSLFAVFSFALLSTACADTASVADEAVASKAPAIQEAPAFDVATVSHAFGHVIGKNLETLGFKFDMTAVIKGVQDALAGKDSPMSEMECIQAIATAQEGAFKKQAADNLQQAETFLSTNAKNAGVVSIEEGKVQYKTTNSGEGAAVQEHDAPLIKYCGKYLDGSVFGSSKEEEVVSLDEVIPGLRAGLIGMKEGEKRTVYIHPDLAYGNAGYLPPNSLLTFEVEIVKASAPVTKEIKDAETPKTPSSEIVDIKGDVR
jgi:peptidylprolyl isomerase